MVLRFQRSCKTDEDLLYFKLGKFWNENTKITGENMRNNKVMKTLVSIFTVLLLSFMVATTVFAVDAPQGDTPVVDTEIATDVVDEPQYVETEVEPDYDFEEETEPVYEEETNAPVEEDDEYIGELQEETQAPTYYEVFGDDLPEIDDSEVVKPTVVRIPDVEVSDTSLMGGVIAWLCVAVGIAVVAGVLFSQRTRQVGSSYSNDRRR